MNKVLLPLAFLLIVLFGCTQKQKPKKPPVKKASFEYFEISYTGRWIGRLSFRVDSNRIFFSPAQYDTVEYGILPDSIFRTIDTTVSLIRSDTTIRSINEPCSDCDLLAINIKVDNDTIEIVQHDQISKPLREVVKQLEFFMDKSKYTYNYIRLRTFKDF